MFFCRIGSSHHVRKQSSVRGRLQRCNRNPVPSFAISERHGQQWHCDCLLDRRSDIDREPDVQCHTSHHRNDLSDHGGHLVCFPIIVDRSKNIHLRCLGEQRDGGSLQGNFCTDLHDSRVRRALILCVKNSHASRCRELTEEPLSLPEAI